MHGPGGQPPCGRGFGITCRTFHLGLVYEKTIRDIIRKHVRGKNETKSEESVEVTFVIQPDGFRHSMLVSLVQTLDDGQNKVEAICRWTRTSCHWYGGAPVSGEQTLKDLGLGWPRGC